jgi:hypothetical protein
MASPTFIQESRLGRAIFQIRDGALYISLARLSGGFNELHFDLRSLDPKYKPVAVRLNFQLLVSGVVLFLCSFALWGLYQQSLIPQEALGYFRQWPVYGIVLSLIMAIRASSRVECFLFSDHWGKPKFFIVRERRQTVECEAFIDALIAHIGIAQSSLPGNEREAVLRKLSLEEVAAPQTELDVPYWKLSLVLGILAASIPWIPNLAYYFVGLEFMLVFSLCVGGAVFCAFSYTTNESNRHWSLLGLILSLIPPFFY